MKFLSAMLILSLSFLLSEGQGRYQINGVKVIQYGDTLQNAWAGGLNNPVFSSIDLNQDGLLDLFIYDKSAWKGLSFINTGSVGHPSFTYAPEYDRMYPSGLRDWAVMRDYNHDGVYDIFGLNENDDMMVYKGIRNGNQLSYVEIYKRTLYPFGNFMDHIWTFSDNMPILMDIDGDGALDVIAPDINSVTVDWYRNIAIDSGYSPDSLVFVLQDQCWGHFTEDPADCNVTLNAMCKKDLPDSSGASSLRHQGGACWGMHNNRNSNVVSAFISDIYCNNVKYLINTGTPMSAAMTSVDTAFPHYDVPVDLPLFPATFGIDADNDGFEDLFIAPFASNGNVPSQSQDRNVVQYYHNNGGTDSINSWHYEGDTLLNNSIVDVGTESHPVFYDYNGDGLMDIAVGNYGHFTGVGNSGASGLPGLSVSSLTLYQNQGTITNPVFQLVDTDWNQLSQYGLTGIYPSFGDLNGDGLPDMVVGELSGNIDLFINRGSATQASYPSMDEADWYGINIGFDAAPFIYDVNGDGLNDLVIGSSGRQASTLGGHIFYYWNYGTPTQPKFSRDSVNDFFGNAVVWDYTLGVVPGFATPFIQKENGSLVLYSGSQRGITFKYAINTDSLRSGSFTLLDSNVFGATCGFRSNVSIADINHDGANDYLAGNIRGGMMLFSDSGWSKSFTDGVADIVVAAEQLVVYPNPAKDKIICRLGKGTQQLEAVELYDMMGASVAAVIEQNNENGITLSIGSLAQGIYVVQAHDHAGKTYQQRVAIIK